MQTIVMNLNDGNLIIGCPTIEVQLWDENGRATLRRQGSLPANPDLFELHESFRVTYQSYYRDLRCRINFCEGDEPQDTRFSRVQFDRLQEQLAAELNRWLHSDSFLIIEQRLRTRLDLRDEIQIIIQASDRQMHQVLWEFWDFYQDYRKAGIVFSFSEYERIAATEPTNPRTESPIEVKILAILGNSTNIEIQTDLNSLEQLPHARVESLVEPTCCQLHESIWRNNWDVLFFAGHSQSENGVGRIYLNSQGESLTLSELENALICALERGLKLAIFSSCDGMGLAWNLAELNIPQIVVFRDSVPDRVAHQFLTHCLQTVAGGKTVCLAVREARERLETLENQYPGASLLPVVFQNPAAYPTLTWPQTTTQVFPSVPLTLTILLACAIAYWSLGTTMASVANRLGMSHHRHDRFQIAQTLYQTATFFDLGFAPAHYNRGWIFKEIGDRDRAIESYRQAALRGLPEGYAEASRLQILDGDYPGALTAISQCLQRSEYDAVRAACLKNQGWVYFEQRRYADAEAVLREAISIDEDMAVAHCFLARVLEAREKPQEAGVFWDNTYVWMGLLGKGEVFPEHHDCQIQAQQRLSHEIHTHASQLHGAEYDSHSAQF